MAWLAAPAVVTTAMVLVVAVPIVVVTDVEPAAEVGLVGVVELVVVVVDSTDTVAGALVVAMDVDVVPPSPPATHRNLQINGLFCSQSRLYQAPDDARKDAH